MMQLYLQLSVVNRHSAYSLITYFNTTLRDSVLCPFQTKTGFPNYSSNFLFPRTPLRILVPITIVELVKRQKNETRMIIINIFPTKKVSRSKTVHMHIL